MSIIENSTDGISQDILLIKKIKEIEGWLSDKEAAVLIEFTRKACEASTGINNIVEIGCYHGRSTVLFGTIKKAYSLKGKVYAIDTHDGNLGAADQGLKSYPPSYDMFKKNIEDAGLAGVVEIIIARAPDIKWDAPVSFLFIDGLHDYENVAADFNHFSDWIEPGGYVAFHDYAGYYPGVVRFVDELLAIGTYKKISIADSLIVIQNKISLEKNTVLTELV